MSDNRGVCCRSAADDTRVQHDDVLDPGDRRPRRHRVDVRHAWRHLWVSVVAPSTTEATASGDVHVKRFNEAGRIFVRRRSDGFRSAAAGSLTVVAL